MKVLLDHKEKTIYSTCPTTFPDEFLNERHAHKIHGQTLKRLNERGGLHPSEMIGNIFKLNFREILLLSTISSISIIKELLINDKQIEFKCPSLICNERLNHVYVGETDKENCPICKGTGKIKRILNSE